MRCMPSSRSFVEKRGVPLAASFSGDIGPGAPVSRSRMNSANTQRCPVPASAAAYVWICHMFSSMVVAPERMLSSAPTTAMSAVSSDDSDIDARCLVCMTGDDGGVREDDRPRCLHAAIRQCWSVNVGTFVTG